MYRIYSTLIEIIAAAIFIVPIGASFNLYGPDLIMRDHIMMMWLLLQDIHQHS